MRCTKCGYQAPKDFPICPRCKEQYDLAGESAPISTAKKVFGTIVFLLLSFLSITFKYKALLLLFFMAGGGLLISAILLLVQNEDKDKMPPTFAFRIVLGTICLMVCYLTYRPLFLNF